MASTAKVRAISSSSGQQPSVKVAFYDRQYLAVSGNGERVIETFDRFTADRQFGRLLQPDAQGIPIEYRDER